MIIDIGNILKNKLIGLPFVDRISGVVQTAIDKQPVTGGPPKIKRFPIGCDVTAKDCADGSNRLTDLVPDDTKKSVFYFEDNNGANYIGRTRNDLNFTADLRLIGWLNMKKLGKDQCSVTSLIVANVIRALTTGKKTFNEAPFTRIKITINKQVVRDPKIFSKYTYDEAETQYLMYPFDYFALDILVEFSINEECMEDFVVDPENECNDI